MRLNMIFDEDNPRDKEIIDFLKTNAKPSDQASIIRYVMYRYITGELVESKMLSNAMAEVLKLQDSKHDKKQEILDLSEKIRQRVDELMEEE